MWMPLFLLMSDNSWSQLMFSFLIVPTLNKLFLSYLILSYPYETLLERGNFLSLSVYRVRCLAIEVFKCVHGNNPAYLNNLFKQSNLKYNLRDSSRLEQPKFHTFTYGLRSFRYYGSKLWNILPHWVKNTKDIERVQEKHYRVVSQQTMYRFDVF